MIARILFLFLNVLTAFPALYYQCILSAPCHFTTTCLVQPANTTTYAPIIKFLSVTMLFKEVDLDAIENVNAFCKEGKKMEEKKGKTETRPWSSRTLMGPPRPLLTVTGARHPCSIL